MPEPPLLVIGGPTASGKTSLALGLAKHLPIEVISADSRQVYRGLDVGTAKPTPAERRRAPHHVLDIIDPSEPFSAHRFSGLARAAIVDIEARGARPVVVGGTGFYIQALLTAAPLGATRPDPELRGRLTRELESDGPGPLAQRLRAIAPKRAATIDLNNPRDRGVLDMARLKADVGFVPQYGLDRSFEDYSAWIERQTDFADTPL